MSDVKKKVVILFGGQSSEHDVSCISGATVAEAVDKDKYEVYLLGITKEGRWVLGISCTSRPLWRGWNSSGTSEACSYPVCRLRTSVSCYNNG